jgi:hypothetical protein
MENYIEFDLTDDEQSTAFAFLTSQWTRCGVTFVVSQSGLIVSVKLSGGF